MLSLLSLAMSPSTIRVICIEKCETLDFSTDPANMIQKRTQENVAESFVLS